MSGDKSSPMDRAPSLKSDHVRSRQREEHRRVRRVLGAILVMQSKLSEEQIQEILTHQIRTGTRFGEAAVDLDMVSPEDVDNALSQQVVQPLTPSRLDAGNELIVASDPYGTASETFRGLRSVLNLADRGRGVGTREAMAVVSPNSRDGRTFVAANLTVAFAQLGRKTLYIDADMRRPRGHSIFNVPNVSGLSEMLAGGTHDSPIQSVRKLPNVYVMTVGQLPANSLELAESPMFDMLLGELRHKFDQIIVDTPAVEFGADARVISSKCGSVLAVCRKGKTKTPALQSMVRWLQSGPAQLAGMVMNAHKG